MVGVVFLSLLRQERLCGDIRPSPRIGLGRWGKELIVFELDYISIDNGAIWQIHQVMQVTPPR